MNKTKKFTNRNFTKRVDHEGGADAPHHPKEPAVCEKCGAVYENRHWTAKQFIPAAKSIQILKYEIPTVCPACKQIEEGVVGGYVSLGGEFFKTHRGEIENLLKNEENRALEDNPLSRVMRRRDEPDGKLVIETTTEHLAQRFGHALEKSFHGEVKYDFSHENKVARVVWERN